MDAGKFIDEIVPLKVQQLDGSVVDFSVDEHPVATPPSRSWRA
jgi:acetyl-CoA acyltransferase